MTKSEKTPLEEALRRSLEDAADDLPAEDDFARILAGDLPDDLRHDPGLADDLRLLMSQEDFPEDSPQSDEDLEADLAFLRARLAEKPAAPANADVLPFARPPAPQRTREAWQTAALWLVTAGSVFWGWSQWRQAERLRLPTAGWAREELIGDESLRGGAATSPIRTLREGPRGLLLDLPLRRIDAAPPFSLELSRAASSDILWRQEVAALADDGALWVLLPAGFLPNGRYAIQVHGSAADGTSQVLDTFLFELIARSAD